MDWFIWAIYVLTGVKIITRKQIFKIISGCSRPCNWLSCSIFFLFFFVSWINYMPLVYYSFFWKACFKSKLIYQFDIMKSVFFLLVVFFFFFFLGGGLFAFVQTYVFTYILMIYLDTYMLCYLWFALFSHLKYCFISTKWPCIPFFFTLFKVRYSEENFYFLFHCPV